MLVWLKERLQNVWFYALVILGIGFICWKVFLQRTDIQKTIVQAGGTAVYWLKDAHITVLPLGCAPIRLDRPPHK